MVKVLRTVEELQRWRAQVRAAGRQVAFVPTMGSLHAGHLELMRAGRARVPAERGELVISIFVNPTQFNDANDLAAYPRDEAGDLALAAAEGVDVAFCPEPDALYPKGASTWVEVGGLDNHLCGASRPGHFRGVCTVVTKLWQLVAPDYGLFGRKDYQQLAILRRMHRDLFLCGEVVGVSTVREPDGLALSSRNVRLDPAARTQALAIPRFLDEVRARFEAGEREVEALLAGAGERLGAGEVHYVSAVDADDLQPVVRVEAPTLVALAVVFSGVRLIDNVLLEPGAS
ncbi:pantoate--beta-alanine ligase [Pseudenhygromyxa sp. WMMC2535]|uniref:pantoate--beta-alanine ligase n=1 Tax=Pseudenhygromyxa sp. WMMC2535 TaxID=2712867 RepID=UPI00155586A2|nr:pantoate--beta-alanine ligase [Pseudenhygromyxa sp. WMMC2535]NVB39220.1 pantoate--beta-alanine ligase [Pseudenhygromyxa sp. WMMC2535]